MPKICLRSCWMTPKHKSILNKEIYASLKRNILLLDGLSDLDNIFFALKLKKTSELSYFEYKTKPF